LSPQYLPNNRRRVLDEKITVPRIRRRGDEKSYRTPKPLIL
jgi:hypothetical protein